MSITFIDWEDMDFGDIKRPLCGICGKHQIGMGDYTRVSYTVKNNNGMEKEVVRYELTQDIICNDCQHIWEWDDDECGYRLIYIPHKTADMIKEYWRIHYLWKRLHNIGMSRIRQDIDRI
tara:strand:- start:14 stop:373 length:360 start_codon:yes stop_codon:yes gene_type:complete